MSDKNSNWNRYATITTLAEKAPKLGRTSLMKFMYFLQTLEEVPLGYDFTLYTYGPFDSTVLYDLNITENLNAIKSEMHSGTTGYGYEITKTPFAGKVLEEGSDFIQQYQEQIDRVLARFGRYSPAALELLSTIVYIDREAQEKQHCQSISELANRVEAVKPRFTTEQILGRINTLVGWELLSSICTE